MESKEHSRYMTSDNLTPHILQDGASDIYLNSAVVFLSLPDCDIASYPVTLDVFVDASGVSQTFHAGVHYIGTP